VHALVRNTGIVLATVLLVGSCGSGGEVPTPQELADALIDEGDITIQALPEAQWDPYNYQGNWGPGHTAGVVPEEVLGGLQISLGDPDWESEQSSVCSPHPLAEPAWQAYAEFSSLSPEERYLTVRELIFADDSATVEDAFEQLRESLTACVGVDAPGRSYETIEAAAVGDEQFALSAPEKSWVVDGEQTYIDRSILVVRKGEVLVGIRTDDLSRESSGVVTQDDVTAIATAAVDKLP
jgi:hypothetical protein